MPFASIVISPLVIRTYPATSMITGICASDANPKRMPTAVNTEPSMMPIGGTQNPATIRPMLTMRQIQNGMVFFAPFIA